MGRKKSISTATLLEIFKEYAASCSNIHELTVMSFSKHLVVKGYNVQHYTLRRNNEFMAYFNKVKQEITAASVPMAQSLTYEPVNWKQYLQYHQVNGDLLHKLQEREKYYNTIYEYAIETQKQANAKINELITAKEKIASLEQDIKAILEERRDIKEKLAISERKTKELKGLAKMYLYPSIYTELYADTSIGDFIKTEQLADPKMINESIISPSTNIYDMQAFIDKMMK